MTGHYKDGKPMRVYLAGPIFGCTDSECKDWRERVKASLSGVESLDPMDRDYRSLENENYRCIVEGDKAAIDSCDVLLVYFVKPSVGTSMEVLYAWERKKHVVVVSQSKQVSPWLQYHSDTVLETLDAGVQHILRMLQGGMKNKGASPSRKTCQNTGRK